MSVFVIGIFAGSLYNLIPSADPANMDKNIPGYAVSRTSDLSNHKEYNEVIDNYFNVNSGQDKSDLKTDEYFGLNIQS